MVFIKFTDLTHQVNDRIQHHRFFDFLRNFVKTKRLELSALFKRIKNAKQ